MVTLLLVVVIGAIGLFLAMPGGRSDLGRAGMILLLAAGGALLYAAAHLAAGGPRASFTVCAIVALFAAVRVITHKRPVYCALYFVLLVAAVTGLLVLMQAEFLAAALLLIYAGAILVTYVFVIMLAQQARLAPYDARSREPVLGVLAGFILLTALAAQMVGGGRVSGPEGQAGLSESARAAGGAGAPGAALSEPGGAATDNAAAGTVENVGTPLLTEYMIGIEIAGLLLTAAMIGAIAIARRRPDAGARLENGAPGAFEAEAERGGVGG